MRSPLFLPNPHKPTETQEQYLQKTAGMTSLPEDPAQWQREILQEAYKQCPYLSDFAVQVEPGKTDGDLGYALWQIVVTPKTDLLAGTDKQQDAGGVKKARIPVVVEGRKLYPLDLMVLPGDPSAIVPLTLRRLHQALFRPQPFDVVAKSPGDTSLIGQLFPPYRMNYGYGSGNSVTVPDTQKMASVPFPLLQEILPTVSPSMLQKCAQALSAADVPHTEQLRWVVESLSAYEGPSQRCTKQASDLAKEAPVTVAQLAVEQGKYLLKTASHYLWEPCVEELTREQAVLAYGSKTVLAAETGGAVTDGEDLLAAEQAIPALPDARVIEDYGAYRCKKVTGEEVLGIVFPRMTDFDGKVLPIALFTNGSESALQGEIAGVRTGSSAPHLAQKPEGFGCFVTPKPDGTYDATVPVRILGSGVDTVGPTTSVVYHAETLEGQALTLLPSQHVQTICTDGDVVLLPASFSWMPLGATGATALAQSPAEYLQQEQEALMQQTVQVDGNHLGEVSLEGAPLAKLDSKTAGLSPAGAEFLLVGCGVRPAVAAHAIKLAMETGRSHYVRAAHQPVGSAYVAHALAKEAEEQTTAKTAALHSYLTGTQRTAPQPVYLWKEAAMMPSPDTVDTVLSLGFMNEENLGTFVSYLPKIEEAQRKMCEMLIGSRLNKLAVLPAATLEKAVKGTEGVLEGLIGLAYVA
jgi:hypothetical protein